MGFDIAFKDDLDASHADVDAPQRRAGDLGHRPARKAVSVGGVLSAPPSTYGLSSYNYAPALKAVALSEIADGFGGDHAGMQRDMASAAPVQRKSAGDIAQEGFQGPASEIPHRAAMESSFGMDFGNVQSYHAPKTNEHLNSHAYTVGNQIAFKSANPSPALVAHELTHVVQHTAGPACKSDNGIDTSGEAEAEAVEAAVASGKPASSALRSSPGAGGGVARKAVAQKPVIGAPIAQKRAPARSEGEGGGVPFSTGFTFSMEGFEKAYDWIIWDKKMSWPTPVPGVNFMVAPMVKVSAKGGVKWGGENKGDASISVGASGEVGVGLSGGIPNVAEVYATINPSVEGGFTLTKHGNQAEQGHGEQGHGQQQQQPQQGHGEQQHGPPSQWSLVGSVAVKGSAKIGVALAGGIIDNAFELGSIDIFKLTGVYFDQTGFRKDKLGFEWGPKIKEAYEWVKKAIDKARQMGRAAIEAAKRAGTAIANAGRSIRDWVTSW